MRDSRRKEELLAMLHEQPSAKLRSDAIVEKDQVALTMPTRSSPARTLNGENIVGSRSDDENGA